MINTLEKLSKKDILNTFVSGSKTDMNIGVEMERLPVFSETFGAVPYNQGVCEFLRRFARSENWDYITDDYNIIGLKQNHDTITLEPGCQIEMSLKPEKTLFDLKNKIDSLNRKMNCILEDMGMMLLEYGVSPLDTYKNISLIPKKRYHIMAKYLWGILSDVMMRETAGIQGCFDFKSEEDGIRKFKIANKLSPFMTAMFANSPIRGGVETGYKSFRALSWLNTDNERCGFALNLDEDFSFEKYVDSVLQSPVIFLNKDGQNIEVNGKLTFDEYMKKGYEGCDATMEDFNLHANLYFPEVRLRNFIEIRNHDCTHMVYSLLAIYKGILYSDEAMSQIEEVLYPFSHNDIAELRYCVPKNALQSSIQNYRASDIAKEILSISRKSLKNMQTGEEKFLEPIEECVSDGICPADIIIKNWNGLWNKDISKLIRYLKNLSD